MFPGKAKDSPIKYGGARETDDLATFIMENVSFGPCTGFDCLC